MPNFGRFQSFFLKNQIFCFRFGKNERSALAEFEYLQDMSTDVSGMQSSPELGQLMGQLMKK